MMYSALYISLGKNLKLLQGVVLLEQERELDSTLLLYLVLIKYVQARALDTAPVSADTSGWRANIFTIFKGEARCVIPKSVLTKFGPLYTTLVLSPLGRM